MSRHIMPLAAFRVLAVSLAAAFACPALATNLPSAQDLAQAPVLRPPRGFQGVLSADQRETYAKAFAAFDAGRITEAHQLAQTGGNPLAQKIFLWMELQSPRLNSSFEEIAGFMAANPDWPNQDILTRRAEDALADRTD